MPDAFDLLGIEPRFSIDAADVERRHRQLLAQLHPDRHRVPESVPAPDLELAPDARES